MDRRQFLAASTLGAATAIAGCTSSLADDDSSTDGTIGAAPDDTDRAIEVSATGEIEAEPDEASLHVGVEADGESAEAVETELAERADALRETFDDLGIPDENVESGRYSVRPDRNGDRYRGTHRFQVVLEDVDRVGDVIDETAAAGADDIGRVNFRLSDERRAEIRGEAVDEALENADAEARHIAENRAVELAGVRSVSTRNTDVVPARAATDDVAEAEADAASSTEIDSGPVTVTADVDVSYGFDGRE